MTLLKLVCVILCMNTYYEWQWLIQNTQQCARRILSESTAPELHDWQGLAAEHFRRQMQNLARQARTLYDVRGGM